MNLSLLVVTQNPFVISNGLVAYYSFNEMRGSILRDYSSNNNNATINGATWAIGDESSCLKFNGILNSATVIPNNFPAINGAKTLSAWINASNIANYSDIMGVFNGSSPSAGTQFRISGLTVNASQWGGTSLIATANVLTANTWQHVVYSFDGTNNKIYVNGSFITSSVTAPQAGTCNYFEIGGFPTAGSGSEYFSGFIDEIRVYNRALSSGEISVLYSSV